MQILDNVIILLLIVLSFLAGKHISDRYNSQQIENLIFQIRLNAAEKGVGYVAPPQSHERNPIGQEFMDTLRANGRATQAIRKPQT